MAFKLFLFCFFFPSAVFADAITPTFTASPDNHYQLTWEAEDHAFSFAAKCRVDSRYTTSVNTLGLLLSKEKSEQAWRAVCSLSFTPSWALNFDLFGAQLPSLADFEARSEALKRIHDEIMNKNALTLKNPRALSDRFRGIDREDIVLGPSEEYVSAINSFIKLVSKKNAEAAVRAAERRKQAAAFAKRRQERETNARIVQVVFVGLGIIILFVIIRSGIIQRGFRVSTDNAAKAIDRTKEKVRDKKRLSAAKELVIWSELREKGHITDEEFEKRKRDLIQ